MSGVCGWLGPELERPIQQRRIEAMAASIPGDTAAAARCLATARGAVAVIAGNNHADVYQSDRLLTALEGFFHWRDPHLAQLAQQHGHAYALAEGYERGGFAVLEALAGSFSLAVIHTQHREVFLAVDSMGTRPLSYAVPKGDHFVFGSTNDCVLAHPTVATELSPQAIFDYLYFNMIPSPRTIYTDVQKLEPAQYLHYNEGRLTKAYYWRPTFEETGRAQFSALAAELHDTLRRAIRRADPDCVAGAFLSGGLDSSTVCGVFAETCQAAPQTYSIGFDVKGYDEMEYARAAAKRFRLDAREYYVTPEDVAEAIPLIARAYDEPFGNSSALPVYCCARTARRDGIGILLAGDGGDELFAGNARYAKQKMFELYSRVPPTIRRKLLEPLLFSFPGGEMIGVIRKARRYVQQANIPLPDRLETYNLLHMLALTEIFEGDFLDSVDPQEPLRMLQEVFTRSNSNSHLNRMLYLDWKITLADNDLRKVNRMCEICGINARYPMLDSELIELSNRVPPDLKLKGFTLRYFFKQALKDFLPREIITKRKHGFGLPFGEWLRSSAPLQAMVNESMDALASRGYIQRAFIDRVVQNHRNEHAGFYGSMLWTLMMLELWLEAHVP